MFGPRESREDKRKRKDDDKIRVEAEITISPVTAEDDWTYHVRIQTKGRVPSHTLETYGGPVKTYEDAVEGANKLGEELAAELRRRVERDDQARKFYKEF